jgi:hypothetical protein
MQQMQAQLLHKLWKPPTRCRHRRWLIGVSVEQVEANAQ